MRLATTENPKFQTKFWSFADSLFISYAWTQNFILTFATNVLQAFPILGYAAFIPVNYFELLNVSWFRILPV